MELVTRSSGGADACLENMGREGDSVALTSKLRARSSSHALTRLSKASQYRLDGGPLPSPAYSMRRDLTGMPSA
eukprot:2863575-Pleurochrysis_carterae.AAC.1